MSIFSKQKTFHLIIIIRSFVRVNLSFIATVGRGNAAKTRTNTPDKLERVLTAATLCTSNALAYK